jgi:hypothetical protein
LLDRHRIVHRSCCRASVAVRSFDAESLGMRSGSSAQEPQPGHRRSLRSINQVVRVVKQNVNSVPAGIRIVGNRSDAISDTTLGIHPSSECSPQRRKGAIV